MQYVQLDPYNVSYKDVETTVNILKNKGIVVFPTDSVVAIGCLLSSKKSINKIIQLTQKPEKKSNMTLFFTDLKEVANYTQHYSNSIYRSVNRLTPGPYTFIFNANKVVTKAFENNKKEVGVRLPDHAFLREVLKQLDEPIISTSLSGEVFAPYATDMEALANDFKHDFDLILAEEHSSNEPTTVLDCTEEEIELIRQGKGAVD